MESAIEQILERIRPALLYDGGDIELVKVHKKTKTVYVRLQGMCSHCAISEITLKQLIEKEIQTDFGSQPYA